MRALAGMIALLVAPLVGQADVVELVQRLGSNNGQQRNAAYRTLLRDRSPEVLAHLGKQIESQSRIGQELSCNLLRGFPLPDAAPVYKKLMAAKAPYLRAVGAARMVQHYTVEANRRQRAKAIRVLTESLAACPPNRVLAAVSQCGNLKDEEVLAQFRALLQPGPAHVVRGLLQQLRNKEGGSSAPTRAAAERLLEAKEPQVRGAALAYLLHDDSSHSEAFARLIKDDRSALWTSLDLLPRTKLDEQVLDALAEALAEARSEHDIRRLTGLMKAAAPQKLRMALRSLVGHEKEKLRDEALAQLGNLPGGFGEKDLLEMLHDKALAVRVVAAGALRRRDNRAGLEPVLEAAKVKGKHQADAAKVLGDYRCREGVPVLLDLLDAKDQHVRNMAWGGIQETLKGLFPYRKFDFQKSGYSPADGSRQRGIATLRAWWASVK